MHDEYNIMHDDMASFRS